MIRSLRCDIRAILVCLLVTFSHALDLQAVDVRDTRLLSDPAISQQHIAFIYVGDLWTANADGSGARRLTTHAGQESNPRFSPDGKLITFSAQYDGNTDVYVVPVEGGTPQRLTWHPGPDTVLGFTRDGADVLFRSPRSVFTDRHTQLFTVAVEGAFPKLLPLPHAHKASYSPDGKRLAYTPLSERFHQWKHYRGGTVSRIWLYDSADHGVVPIAQPKGRCNDTDPMWLDQGVFFRSDRSGEFNLFLHDVESGTAKQLTHYNDFPVLGASAGAGKVIYEQGGHLHVYDPEQQESTRLRVGVAADLIDVRSRYVGGNRYVRTANISPSGARAVFGYRGEIITVPAEKGDPRNLTQTPAVHERSPVWSPDGKTIAYFSDVSGEYELQLHRVGEQAIKRYKLTGAGFYETPVWSPDSKAIAYSDNSLSLYWLDVDSGVSKKIGQEYLYGPRRSRNIHFSWSPDSKWITYALNSQTYIRKVYVYSLAEHKSFPITDGLSDVSDPVFDASGKYLYFLSSTDAGPVRQWFDQSSADMEMTSSIYLAVLPSDLISPLTKESDEEEGPASGNDSESKDEGAKDNQDDQASADKDADEETDGASDVKDVRIDFAGLDQRIVVIPMPPGNYSNLQCGRKGDIYFLEAHQRSGDDEGGMRLRRFRLDTREAETVLDRADTYYLTNDGKKVLYRADSDWAIAKVAAKVDASKGKLGMAAIQVRIDPRSEWKQIFEEVWRINRDYFYDPNFHGVDWGAMRDKYAPFLPHLASRDDLNRLIQWMCSELAVGHHRVFGGDRLAQLDSVPGGLLGADYEIDNDRYRFSKVYGGLNWNPEMRSPLTEPGVGVDGGDYLIEVEGRPLTADENLYSRFENTAGKIVRLKVSTERDGKDARTVSVVPVANEYALRNRDWVEGNLRKVEKATDGRVAYVYVPDTANTGHAYFKRYFFPQAHKEAIILDERFNGGGLIADYYIDHLRKPVTAYWATRYGADLKTPSASIQGPRVMIIDETAGSGGDLLPWMFRRFELGPLVGKRTWGGLVGMLGFPVLMDGGLVTAPNLAIWTEDGWVVENFGVPPDIEVEQWPAEVIAGRDPQLEKAIEVVMEALAESPPARPQRPPFPVRNPPRYRDPEASD